MSTALVVIDVQKGMFRPPLRPYRGEEVLARIRDLQDRARAERIPVVMIQHDGGPGEMLSRDSAGFAVHAEVAPKPGEEVIVKTRCDAFLGTGLDARLRALGIGRLVIAGMQTDFCIDTACRVAHGMGYDVTLAEDAHTTLDNAAMTAPQLIAYHGDLLKDRFATFKPVSQIDFGA